MGQIFISPFGKTRFRELFVADFFSSLIKVFADLTRTSCFYASGSWVMKLAVDRCEVIDNISTTAVSVLPLLWRFLQCVRRYYDTRQRFPHFANAFKYALAQTIILMGVFHPLYTHTSSHSWNAHRLTWLIGCILSGLYTFSWDLVMDWGLVTNQNEEAPLLRKKLVFSNHKWVYYTAIVIDFVLRFAWTVTILPSTLNPYWGTNDSSFNKAFYEMVFLPILMALEVGRRAMWGIIRVEYEHLQVLEKFEKYDYAPVYFQSDGADLEGEVKTENVQKDSKRFGIVLEIVLAAILVVVASVIVAVW
eukprot:TRINITY_DN42853_c0_g1_i2.p1 TRINITY_DN42853_c0_g1~~TRINITY_DN42853_c0_g1_i2.p1  ORF type:complete len:317 (-),score=38.84 TRINITY_DN42853_c0_g1_i2:80-994(-)